MSTTAETRSILDRYFSAWQDYDLNEIGRLFRDDATYERQGKNTIAGIAEIENYWKRNKGRQSKLNVLPHVPLNGALNACAFCARFTDVEERQRQIVHGWMEIDVVDGKISRLKESYYVDREPLRAYFLETLTAWLQRQLRRIKWKLVEWRTQALALLTVNLSRAVYYLLLIILGGSAFSTAKLPDVALCVLAADLTNCQFLDPNFRSQVESEALQNLRYIILAAVIVLPFLYKLRHGFLKPVETIRLVGEGQDLEVMKKRFRKARELVVYAGDFDFVGRDADLLDIFARFDQQGELRLVSDKSEDVVRRGFGSTVHAAKLFQSLVQKGRISFNDPKGLRCSIVKRWDFSEVLYRYEHGGGEEDQHRLRICVLRGRGDASPVVELLRRSIRSAA